MSNEDELDNLLNDIGSSDDTPSGSESEEAGGDVATIEVETTEVSTEEYTMTSDELSEAFDSEGSPITQAEVYDNLKRIGELEDEKLAIQEELRRRTEQLRAVLKHIDRGSILYKMLTSALPASSASVSSSRAPKKSAAKPAKAAAKKPAKKKTAATAPKAAPAKKKAAKKKTAKRKTKR